MLIRSLFTGLATSLMLVSNVAAASQPTEYPALLVEVTNTSHVCQRFDASGREYTPRGDKHVPPYLQREAAPGETVTFEGLEGQRSMVWATPHETKECTSRITGIGYTYSPPAPRAKITFDGTTFHFVGEL